MASPKTQRKLTAILCADVVGYSRLMGADEEATVETLTAYRKVFSKYVKDYRGRVVNAPGDSILAEFASVVDAVNGAVEIQRILAERNAELPDERRMEFRIGINLGDVVVAAAGEQFAILGAEVRANNAHQPHGSEERSCVGEVGGGTAQHLFGFTRRGFDGVVSEGSDDE